MVVCSLCASHFPSLSFLLTHIRLEHADQPNFQKFSATCKDVAGHFGSSQCTEIISINSMILKL